jgi:hypothetical protein
MNMLKGGPPRSLGCQSHHLSWSGDAGAKHLHIKKMAITVIGNIPIFGLTGLWNFAHIADRK